jgi:hypothetical protein
MTNLKRLFDNAWKAAEHRSWVKGLLGRPNGDATHTVAVADRPGFVYVRVAQGGGESVTIAKNLGRVANRANLPVKMRLEAGGTYTIIEVDSTTYSAATPDDDDNDFGVTAHTHRIGTGLEYEIEPERFEPGRVYPDSGMSVYVNPFRYHWNGEWKYWAGDRIDLASVQPTTSGKWAWVLVGINPATNAVVAVAGAEQNTQADLTLDLLNDIAFSYYIPCGAVQVAEADMALSDFTRYYDAHAWYTAHHDFGDSEGNPADVTTSTPADGTSVYAARRDHAHGLADNVVTNAKLRDSGALSVIGRSANSSGDPADISATAASGAVLRESGSTLGFGTVATAGLADDAATNAKLANMAEATVKARKAASGTGDPLDIALVDGPEIAWVWASPADELTLVLVSGGIGSTALANDAVTDAKLRNSGALSVIGRSANSSGDPADISATAASGAVLRESGSTLGFGTVATAGLADDAATNAKLANMAEATIKGRAAGAGTGDPTDLTAAQVRAIIGSSGATLNVNTTTTGNVGTGEDTLASYTVPAGQLATNGDTLWFEAFGTMAANANSKTVRARFGSSGTNLMYAQTSTSWGTHWSIKGRIYRTGSATQKSSADLISDNDDNVTTQTATGLNQDLTATVALSVTGEAVADNDIVLEGLIVGWMPAP